MGKKNTDVISKYHERLEKILNDIYDNGSFMIKEKIEILQDLKEDIDDMIHECRMEDAIY